MQFKFKLFSKAEWRTNLFKICTNNETFEIKMTGSTYIVEKRTSKKSRVSIILSQMNEFIFQQSA